MKVSQLSNRPPSSPSLVWCISAFLGVLQQPVGFKHRDRTKLRQVEPLKGTLRFSTKHLKSSTYSESGPRSSDEFVSGGSASKPPCILQKPVVYGAGREHSGNKHTGKRRSLHLQSRKGVKRRRSPLRSAISSNSERVTKAVLFRTPLHPVSPLCFFTHGRLENMNKQDLLGHASAAERNLGQKREGKKQMQQMFSKDC